jgi:multidrug transporter EmrE-like cation transporter
MSDVDLQLQMLDDGRIVAAVTEAADKVQALSSIAVVPSQTKLDVSKSLPAAVRSAAPALTKSEVLGDHTHAVSSKAVEVEAPVESNVAPRSEAEIRRLSTIVIALAFAVVTAMLIALGTLGHRTWLGWIGVVSASVIFSTTTVPMKLPSLATSTNDPMIFALFTGLGIFIVSIPICIYLWAINSFVFVWWPALGATLIFFIGFFAFNAVSLLGVAVASACWSGIGMLSAFLFGSLGFQEPIAHPMSAGIAVALLMLGVFCVSSSKSATESSFSSGSNVFKGLLFCLANGLADGSLMVPFKMVHAVTLVDSFNYLASFGIHALVLSPILFTLYIKLSGKQFPAREQIQVALFPGLGSGVLWACANLMSVRISQS